MNLDKLKNWKKTYGVKNILLRGIYSKFPIIPVANNELLRRMNWQFRVRRNLKNYLVVSSGRPDLEQKNPYRHTIWVMWFQGIKQAPEVVKKCYESVKKYSLQMGYNVILLDENNMFEYIHIPSCIVKKWKKGIVGNANFSDICRIALLAEYGGIWLDSTILLTGEIDREILDADIFFFRASFLDLTATQISSWLLSANKAGNELIMSIRDTLFKYWKSKNIVDDYFVFHLIVAELMLHPQLKDSFKKIPFFTNTYPLLMERELNNIFEKKKFEHILKCSTVHKLTYKGLDENTCDSFYKYILKMEV